MVGTQTTGNPLDEGQVDLRNMFPDVCEPEGKQVSAKTDGKQARNRKNTKETIEESRNITTK